MSSERRYFDRVVTVLARVSIRWHQLVQSQKHPEKCAHWSCNNDWHAHVLDVRLCKEHHPDHDEKPSLIP